jgi:DNA polymerase III subunit delta
MPRRSFDDVFRAIGKGTLAPVYYLHGAEDVLKDELVRAIIEKALDPADRDFNLDQRDAAGLDPESLHALVNTLPMLAARRVAVVRGIEAWKRKTALRTVLLKYLENPAADTVLILVQGAGREKENERPGTDDADAEIEARSQGVEVKPLEPDRVAKWIARHAGTMGVTFAEGAAEHLALCCDYDLGAIRTELEKFGGLAEGEPVTVDRVGDLVGVRRGETVYDWVAAVMAGETARATELVPVVLGQSGVSAVRMVTQLGTTLNGVALARALFDRDLRNRALEQAIFERLLRTRPFGLGDWKRAAADWARWAQAWTPPRLTEGLRAALAADQSLKATRFTDDTGLLLHLALQLMEPGRETGGHRAGLAATTRT